ncbi:MAG TPA: activator of (R)-2-hydroxyglutaryl-CoA dehydratase [Candidatus Hydrogenedentes bacterium]|nr:activator of (R)-2-hydroxyglutaryl-CoA dehydratase [Candidatus Hydrogenedentota bacterium]HPC17166.1 activator of (R)-2-hydroxyglutaryl-CoA dehydratase [Candidatus Hydrogenedentota bacterium]HRT20468.1 activator of (R)-2-hydroxyglutaryl-CoA dehydratase [Candidatus Hydrogenedentota bacterium]HRT65197.1 activator of (R)-2-hydroxyglutaryl-CoA dehydratase [Candidatus Hydrogenedentota bacterium]
MMEGQANQTHAAHYRRSECRPFTRAERDRVTVLYGGLTERHGVLLGAAFAPLGYRSEALPTPTNADYRTGRELGNPGMCNPAYFTIGALVNRLRRLRDETGLTPREINDAYVFVTAGSCGPCRFGMYEEEFGLALRNSGFEGFRVILFQEKGGLKQSGEEDAIPLNARFAERFITCLMVGDLLNDLAMRIRPYEIVPGQTERTFGKVMKIVCDALRRQTMAAPTRGRWLTALIGGALCRRIPGLDRDSARCIAHRLFDDTLVSALARCAELIDREIEVDFTRPKPLCKVTGEFWAQLTEGDGNYRLFEFLESEGAEVAAEPVMTWVNYLIDVAAQRFRHGRGGTTKQTRDTAARSRAADWKGVAVLRLTAWLLNRDYERMRRALRGVPHPQIPQAMLRKLARPFFNTHIVGGEGHMEIGKTLYCALYRKAHLVISVKPFGCLPSTQSDGVQPAVAAYCARQGRSVHFVSIETSGDGAVHAYSRLQSALDEARQVCEREFEEALAGSGASLESIRAYCRKNPAFRRPLYCVGQENQNDLSSWSRPSASHVAGRAAQFVTLMGNHLSAQSGPKKSPIWHDATEAQG